MALVAVFDTNILFSATGWRGNPYRCVEQARTGVVQIVSCAELMEELVEKLELRLGFSAEQSAQTLADYLSFIQLVSLRGNVKGVSRDPDDDLVLECAVEGSAEFIVSGDSDLLDLKEFRGIKIVRSREFLEILVDRAK